jgi:hypothetical protein
LESCGQEQCHGSHWADPRQHSDQGPNQYTEGTEEEIGGFEGDLKAIKDAVKESHYLTSECEQTFGELTVETL